MENCKEKLKTIIDIVSEDLVLVKYFKVKSVLAKQYDLADELRDVEKKINAKKIDNLTPLEAEIYGIAANRPIPFMRNNLEFMFKNGKFRSIPTRTLSRTLSGMVKNGILKRNSGNEYSLNG